MNIAKTVKKIAALVAGTTMLGATIMGATALDLSNYPAPFVTNGVWDGKIIVGAKAATSDVVGAIDLAAALQADATTTSEVNVPGAAGTASVIGDSAEFKAGTDILAINEPLNETKTTFGVDDLEALKSGVLDTGAGTTPVKQYLKFQNDNADVVYEANADDVLGDYLYFADGTEIFEYHMEFTESAISEIDGTDLPDFNGEVLNIMGAPYTIVDATLSGSDITLKLMGGETADVLRDGETKTYDIKGKSYEVTAVFIDSDVPSAKLSVNGVMTKELKEGDTQVLGSDVTVGIQEILTNQREGLVEFYLGANKLELSDDNINNTIYNDESTVKVGTTSSLSNVDLIIKGTFTSDELKLSYIKYHALTDDEYWIPKGKGIREFLQDPEVMLGSNWDIVYTGLMSTGTTDIEFNPVSDYGYKLGFTNVDGDAYSVPYLSSRVFETNQVVWGSDKYRLVFTEWGGGLVPQLDNETFVSQKDYFVVSDKVTDATTVDDAITRVLKYVSISTSTKVVNFEDLTTGSQWGVSYIGTVGEDAEGDLIIDGKTHKFYVGNESADDAEEYALSVDLDASGSIVDGTQVYAIAKGGAILDLGAQTFTDGILDDLGDDSTTTLTIRTPLDLFDESPGTLNNITVDFVDDAAQNEMSLDVTAPTLSTDDANDNYQKAMTDYGAYIEEFTPDTGASSAKVEFPSVQRGAQVFVTAGTVEVKESSSTSGGALTTTTVNPIAVGLAVLDTEAPAIGSKNMIVIGGPCINTVAAALMGNQADCTAGFTAGKAIIKLFADKNALLVAGYSAQDTLGACRVLAKYDKYDLSGTEVEVIAADLSALSVNKVQ